MLKNYLTVAIPQHPAAQSLLDHQHRRVVCGHGMHDSDPAVGAV